MEIKLGDVQVHNERMSLQVHQEEGDILHILSVMTGAQAKMPSGEQVHGVVVDIDSIRTISMPDFDSFVANLEQGVEELRQANKAKFFSCLTDTTIEEMEPIYE